MTKHESRTGRLSRRALLGGGAAAAGGLLLSGCAAPASGPSPALSAGAPAVSPGSSAAVSSSPSSSSGTIVVYFSRPGENYYNGGRRTLQTGNTAVLARMLVDQLGCAVHELEASEPYSSGYDAAVARNVTEQQNDSRPAIAGPPPSLDGYSTVLLGSPIWNVRPPMIMNTFVEGIGWTGKTLYPFVTYAVSGLGRTVSVYERAARRAQIGDGLAVRGEEVAGAGDQAAAWLRSISLL